MDLFYGQLKSRVQCTVCSKVSISFDPFNMLSVPIPQVKEQKISVKYFPYKIEEEHKEFVIVVPDSISTREIKLKIQENISPEGQSKDLLFSRVKNKNQIMLLNDQRFQKNEFDKSEELCLFEIPSYVESNYFLIEVKFTH